MRVLGINNVQNQNHINTNFKHTMKVSICVLDSNGKYNFVSPAKNRNLYKNLSRKLVSWFNSDFNSKLHYSIGHAKKSSNTLKMSEKNNIRRMVDDLILLDSDFAEMNILRSVYDKHHQNYLATGIDEAIVENLKGAKEIGIAKSELKKSNGKTHSRTIDCITKIFQNNAREYVTNPINLLRDKQGKEIMLRANFRPVEAKGKIINYELDNYEYYSIKSSKTLSKQEKEKLIQKQNMDKQDLFLESIEHKYNRIENINQDSANQSERSFLEDLTEKMLKLQRKSKDVNLFRSHKKTKKDTKIPEQLEIDFGKF